MIFLLILINTLLAVFVFITVINSVAGPRLKDGPEINIVPKVSVLVPARNEEDNISTCLDSLSCQDYPDFEIIVLDDCSEDNTSDVVNSFAPKVKLIKGEGLPDGWTGKNWACHQLSKEAKGDILLFTDADNYYRSDAISRTVGWMQKLNLDLISAFPQQITKTLGEKLIVPVVDLFVYSFLLLWLTYLTKFPSLAAANGQWIAFRKSSYEKLGGHRCVRSQVVEDVELSRNAKKQGMKILTTTGRDIVYGHMYHSWKEVWNGFSKNLFGLVGYNSFGLFIILILFAVVFVLPYFMIFFVGLAPLSLIAFIQILVLRFVLSTSYGHPILVSVLLNPLSFLIIIGIGINSFNKAKNGGLLWKGRQLKFN